MFERVLIANRGEIAVRVIRACRELGVSPAVVYSDADARSPHVALADRAVRIGAAPPAESYLATASVLSAARQVEADAIHPGYGFLSENPAFAAACAAAEIAFIGPPAAVLASLGSKIEARALAERTGVPLVPGATPADQSNDGVAAAARSVGLPVLIKPSAGGGGIGMKEVREADRLVPAIEQARREALAAFGDGTLYVERLLERPRHVEVQIFADRYGHVVHLFERECSIQRRHQKVVEESPSPALTPVLRSRMGEAAVALARAAGYLNAGTVEFLLDGAGDAAPFYFLEVNARLQVEHGVTEQVTGVDLVRAQIIVASGGELPWTQRALTQRGHAIEARVCAEDPAQGGLPQAGALLLYREPVMPGVRVDAGVIEGGEVSVYYDSLIAKLVATGESRETARRRAVEALRAFPILGVRTNIAQLIAILEHPRFVAGDLDIRFLDTQRIDLPGSSGDDALATATAREVAAAARAGGMVSSRRDPAPPDPWSTLRGFRG